MAAAPAPGRQQGTFVFDESTRDAFSRSNPILPGCGQTPPLVSHLVDRHWLRAARRRNTGPVSIERGVVHISKELQYLLGRGLVLTEPKTESGKRIASLPEFVPVPLKAYLDTLKANQHFLFETYNGTPISPCNLLRHFHAILREIGLTAVPFNNLRHLSASLSLLAGVNPKTVQQRLGHSTISLTLITYSHLLPGIEEEAVKKMIGLISGD